MDALTQISGSGRACCVGADVVTRHNIVLASYDDPVADKASDDESHERAAVTAGRQFQPVGDTTHGRAIELDE